LKCQGTFAGARRTGDDNEGGNVCHAGIIACTYWWYYSIRIKALAIHNNINELTNLFYCNYNGLQ
jgi:hypothetical protein